MRKIIIGVLAGLCVSAAAAGAATQYIITSTSQISPSVLTALKGNVGPQGPAGPGVPTYWVRGYWDNITSQSGGITAAGSVTVPTDPYNPATPTIAQAFRFPRDVSKCAAVVENDSADHANRPQTDVLYRNLLGSGNVMGVAGSPKGSTDDYYSLIVTC